MTAPSSPVGVELQFRNQIDHLGAYRRDIRLAILGRADLWSMVDAAGDEDYENAIKGVTVTDIDLVLDEVRFGSQTSLRQWWSLHNSYFANVAGLENPPGTAVSNVNEALSNYRF